jgi:hypothetical protein
VFASVIRVIPTIARHHTAKQSRETGGFAPRGSGALGAAARSIRTIELDGEGVSRLLKVRPATAVAVPMSTSRSRSGKDRLSAPAVAVSSVWRASPD